MNHESDHSQHPEHWEDQLESEAINGSQWMEESNRPQAESISVASVWQMDSPATAEAALAGESGVYAYRRDGHPNERSLASKLAKLHRAPQAVITAQGMSSLAAVAWSVLKPGARAWVGKELYGKSSKLFTQDLTRWQVEVRTFDPTDPQDVAELGAAQADLVLVETMSNPRLRVPNLTDLADATHRAGGVLIVDNTFATHLLCRPLEHGADFALESLSKQVNGHSDSMLGVVAGRDPVQMEKLLDTVSTFGLASSPLDCYLTHRGLLSLGVRVERACANALALAKAMEALEEVTVVDYPGLTQHPQHRLATQQLTGGFGWMLSFRINGDRPEVQQLMEALRPEIAFAPSLGDVATTVSHPASTSHRGMAPEVREQLGIFEATIRVSCGIEPTEWLVERFERAFRSLPAGRASAKPSKPNASQGGEPTRS